MRLRDPLGAVVGDLFIRIRRPLFIFWAFTSALTFTVVALFAGLFVTIGTISMFHTEFYRMKHRARAGFIHVHYRYDFDIRLLGHS